MDAIRADVTQGVVANEIVKQLPGDLALLVSLRYFIVVGLEVDWDHEFLIDFNHGESGIFLGVSGQRPSDKVHPDILGGGAVSIGRAHTLNDGDLLVMGVTEESKPDDVLISLQESSETMAPSMHTVSISWDMGHVNGGSIHLFEGI